MKVLSGHLTAMEKNVIKQMLSLKLTSAKTPKKIFHYRKDLTHFYKVVNEEKAIQVTTFFYFMGINLVHKELALKDTEECTEEEYLKAFKQVLETLQS